MQRLSLFCRTFAMIVFLSQIFSLSLYEISRGASVVLCHLMETVAKYAKASGEKFVVMFGVCLGNASLSP